MWVGNSVWGSGLKHGRFPSTPIHPAVDTPSTQDNEVAWVGIYQWSFGQQMSQVS